MGTNENVVPNQVAVEAFNDNIKSCIADGELKGNNLQLKICIRHIRFIDFFVLYVIIRLNLFYAAGSRTE